MTDESQAIREIERLGGKIKRDENFARLPGDRSQSHRERKLRRQRPLPAKDVHEPDEPQPRPLRFRDHGRRLEGTQGAQEISRGSVSSVSARITDAGLKELKQLKNLANPQPSTFADHRPPS